MNKIEEIQVELRDREIPAWLFYDHHHRDAISYRILGLPESLMVSRRWFYLIPAQGEPVKLVHRIEPYHLDALPGKKHVYAPWDELVDQLRRMLSGFPAVAMQYSPNNMIFTVSTADAGTVDLIRSFGVNVISSANLVARFEATWTEEQIRSHFEAGKAVDAIMAAVFPEIGTRVRNGGTNEFEIQQWIVEMFRRENLIADAPPIVAVNQNSSDPHYAPAADHNANIREGDVVLLDVWGKQQKVGAVYYDISWTGFVGPSIPDRVFEIFDIVRRSRDAGIGKVTTTIALGKKLCGWEVDKAARDVLVAAGYGKYLNNRVGHSIGTEVHGNGANMDDFESRDEREVLPNTCFSIEPGIYLPEFGLRSEVNMLVRKGSAEVTGRVQNELVVI
ncbi:MAG TPA: Xaa-Pro peptidase family protein [Candidatus Sulfotelmatobacter sp.]|nr:Xaa-Pro peptidase family protein [Candidatus Sulfotelmatobacter sp.]